MPRLAIETSPSGSLLEKYVEFHNPLTDLPGSSVSTIMRIKLQAAVILFLVSCCTVLAHPGIDIVMDNRGNVFYTDLYDLVRITLDGTVKTLARGLASWNVNRLLGPDRHAIMGLRTDRQGNVNAAVFANRVVKRVQPDGSATAGFIQALPGRQQEG